jgi:hypothetical protein
VRLRDRLVDDRLRARLLSVRDVCERDRLALQARCDPRLEDVLLAMSRLQAEIVAALASLGRPPTNVR